ncbi:hypothetical protein G5I_09385 [Acromyrmex echinatior]|uniref:Uncharacterized protein n=1 Tax=Acromyrmex echinatior TaxID=103372 RepID=F4WU30_ACREC|nr:hypothetical protein G5I_09385 [Acromyrmex echinatior]
MAEKMYFTKESSASYDVKKEYNILTANQYCRDFIENEQAIVFQDGSGQAYELPLTDVEVMTAREDIVSSPV